VGVIIEAQHMCMMMRGVEKQNSLMKTSAMLGSFRADQKTRDEFLALLRLQSMIVQAPAPPGVQVLTLGATSPKRKGATPRRYCFRLAPRR
jgi:hypothetical protein